MSASASHGPDLLHIVAVLAAMVIAVPLFKRIGLGQVLGYLAAGLVIGPFGIGLFSHPETILHVAEFGVVMFLFIIGLEMQPSRLWAMRGEIFGLGLIQVAVCIMLLWTVGMALGYPPIPSFIAGTGFVMTSTAIVMQTLEERRQLDTPPGRRMVAILLLEDLAIVPLLALVVFLAPNAEKATTAQTLQAIAIGIGSVAALIVAGRYLLDPLFRLLANTNAREVMTAAALLVVLGSALLMQMSGLSMAMGAFLAGALLSESTFRHQLEADVEPFRGMLLGLFFLGVGMTLDVQLILRNWELIAKAVAAYMVLKFVGIFIVARLFRSNNREALERAVMMAQGGEFAFVLFSTAASVGIYNATEQAILTAIIIVSMVLTPLMLILHSRIKWSSGSQLEGVDVVGHHNASILMIGFGRFGQIVSQPLFAAGYSLTIIDKNPDFIRQAQEFGFKVYYGDGCRLDILHAAGAHEARTVIIATDSAETTTRIAHLMKSEFPLVPVLARAYDREHAAELVNANVDYHIRETYESAVKMGARALQELGNEPEVIDEIMDNARRRDAERFALEVAGGIYAGRDYLLDMQQKRAEGEETSKS